MENMKLLIYFFVVTCSAAGFAATPNQAEPASCQETLVAYELHALVAEIFRKPRSENQSYVLRIPSKEEAISRDLKKLRRLLGESKIALELQSILPVGDQVTMNVQLAGAGSDLLTFLTSLKENHATETRWMVSPTASLKSGRAILTGIELEKILRTSIRETDLPWTLANKLMNGTIIFVGDLVQENEDQLLRLPNIGNKSLSEIKSFVDKLGLHLGMHNPQWPFADVDYLTEMYPQRRIVELNLGDWYRWGRKQEQLEQVLRDGVGLKNDRPGLVVNTHARRGHWIAIVSRDFFANNTPTFIASYLAHQTSLNVMQDVGNNLSERIAKWQNEFVPERPVTDFHVLSRENPWVDRLVKSQEAISLKGPHFSVIAFPLSEAKY
jgi:hypothetical protein